MDILKNPAIPLKTDGTYLHGMGRHLPDTLRKSIPEGRLKKVVPDFQRVAGLYIQEHRVHGVGLYCREDFGTDQAY